MKHPEKLTRRSFLQKTTAAVTGGFMSFAKPSFPESDLDFKIGQMIMTHFAGLQMNDEIRHLILYEHLGGVLLFESNFASAASPKASLYKLVSDLHKISPAPLFIAMDQEGGAVNRLKEKYSFPQTYSARYLGERNDLNFTKQAADTIASTLADIGINHNFAPVVDLNVNPRNPVVGATGRCFSAYPEVVTRHASVFVQAHQEQHIISTLKHFPGHGSSTQDSHAGLADVTQTWRRAELIPYRRLIQQGRADSIMTAHIFNANLDEKHPASLSYKTITGILRQNLGFDGVVISDDLLMGAIKDQYDLKASIYHAVNAGNDILLFTTIANDLILQVKGIIKEHVKSGRISMQRINESHARIKKLKRRLVERTE